MAADASKTPVTAVSGPKAVPIAPVTPISPVAGPLVDPLNDPLIPVKPTSDPTPPRDASQDDAIAEARASRQSQGFPPQMAQTMADHEVKGADDAPKPLHEHLDRDIDGDDHGMVEGALKIDQAGSHVSEASPGEIVADTSPDQTLAKGLNEDGTGANGLVPGDRVDV